MKVFHKILLGIVFLLLLTPIIQGEFNIFKIRGLRGAFTPTENVTFKTDSIFSNGYQQKKEKYLSENFGFRNDAIRIRNQILFSFFNKAKANGVLVGKGNYLYEEDYIKSYFGVDFVSKDSIKTRIEKLKFVQEELEKKGKTIFFVIAPGKGSFYPEYFPEEYQQYKKSTTNYEVYQRLLSEYKINHIDFNRYFLQHKKDSPYLLYPKYGIHWSHYGSCLVSDSIIRYIENKKHIDLANLTWQKVNLENAHDNDIDISRSLNLLFDTKLEKMGYPEIIFTKGSAKPNVLTIGDSFFWTLIDAGILNSFNNFDYWFYNREKYIDRFIKPEEVGKLSLENEIKKNEVIIILCNEANLKDAGWGFVENSYKLFR